MDFITNINQIYGVLIIMILNNYILRDFNKEIDEMENEFQLMYLASTIVDGTFN